jgi:hypothetical protein
MKTEKIVIERYKNLMTGKERIVKYTRVKSRNGISNLYKSNGHYYTHGILGWFNVDKHIK